jgi:hypothetical protein
LISDDAPPIVGTLLHCQNYAPLNGTKADVVKYPATNQDKLHSLIHHNGVIINTATTVNL